MFLRNFCKHRRKIKQNLWKSHSEDCVQGGGTENEELRNIGHSARKVADTNTHNFGSQQWLRFHICLIMILYYKMWQILLNAIVILLQNTKVYCKMRQVFYYKMRQLLQNATVITKCDRYYKMRRLLQNESGQS